MKKKINKNHNAGFSFLKTPINLWDRTAQLKRFTKDGKIHNQVLHYRIKGKQPSEEYGYVILEGLDMPVPGAGSPIDYLNMSPSDIAPHGVGRTIDDLATCSVDMQELGPAITQRNHNPELLGSIVRDMIRCEEQWGYDKLITKDVAVELGAAHAVKLAQEYTKQTGNAVSDEDLKRAVRDARAEAGEFWEKDQRQRRSLTEDAIAQAVDFLIECSEPGRVVKIPVHVSVYGADSINLVCGELDSIRRLNPKRLADKIHEELKIITDNEPPIPQADKPPSVLPLVLAAGGLLVGGPIGAAGGFAIGKALEK